jgi:ketol-acid reductoisomerase
VLPVFDKLYRSVKAGRETAEVLRDCGRKDYSKFLEKKLGDIGNSEMWRAGQAVRALRPKEKAKAVTRSTKGIAGRKGN